MFYVVRNVFYFGLSLTNQTLGSRLVSEDDKLKERGVSLPPASCLPRPIMLEEEICERVIGEHKLGQR